MRFRQFGQAGRLPAEGFAEDGGADRKRRILGWRRRRRRRVDQVEQPLDDVAEYVVIGRRSFDVTSVRRRPLSDHILILHKVTLVQKPEEGGGKRRNLIAVGLKQVWSTNRCVLSTYFFLLDSKLDGQTNRHTFL